MKIGDVVWLFFGRDARSGMCGESLNLRKSKISIPCSEIKMNIQQGMMKIRGVG